MSGSPPRTARCSCTTPNVATGRRRWSPSTYPGFPPGRTSRPRPCPTSSTTCATLRAGPALGAHDPRCVSAIRLAGHGAQAAGPSPARLRSLPDPRSTSTGLGDPEHLVCCAPSVRSRQPRALPLIHPRHQGGEPTGYGHRSTPSGEVRMLWVLVLGACGRGGPSDDGSGSATTTTVDCDGPTTLVA